MRIRINGIYYSIEEATSACEGCTFYREDTECPYIEDDGQLCKHLDINKKPIVFKVLPTFEEDIMEYVESMDLTAKEKDTLIAFLIDGDNITEVTTIARAHDIL